VQTAPAQSQLGIVVPQGLGTHVHSWMPRAELTSRTGRSFIPHLGAGEQLDNFPSDQLAASSIPPVPSGPLSSFAASTEPKPPLPPVLPKDPAIPAAPAVPPAP